MKNLSSTLGAYNWDPERFWLVRHSFWLEGIKRSLRLRGITHGDNLFLYIARATGTTVLGYWVRERQGGLTKSFVALTSLDTYPDSAPHRMPSAEFVAHRIRPARQQAKAGLQALKEESYEELLNHEREEDSKKEWLRFIKKKDGELYEKVRKGRIPVAFDDDSRLTEALNMVADRIRKRPMITRG